MKRFLIAALFCLPLAAHAEGAAKDPTAKGDAAAGQAKSATCSACHGPTGNSANPEWPSLAGQSAPYITSQLKAFQKGERKNPLMMGPAATLTEADMNDLAAFYSAQKPKAGLASKGALAVAQKLYRAGDAARGIAACSACHGPTGAGNAAAAYPRVSGQHATYTAAQLRSFRAGERNVGLRGQMMTATAAKLTDQEIDALASYMNGLQ